MAWWEWIAWDDGMHSTSDDLTGQCLRLYSMYVQLLTIYQVYNMFMNDGRLFCPNVVLP